MTNELMTITAVKIVIFKAQNSGCNLTAMTFPSNKNIGQNGKWSNINLLIVKFIYCLQTQINCYISNNPYILTLFSKHSVQIVQ